MLEQLCKTLWKLPPITGVMTLFGCHSPLVPIRHLRYSVLFSEDGIEREVHSTYLCYYESSNLISESGSSWHVRGDLRLAVPGYLQSGEAFVISPLDHRLNEFSTETRCPAVQADVESQVYVRDKDNTALLLSFDTTRNSYGKRRIKILRSTIYMDRSDLGAFEKQQSPPSDHSSPNYYTVVAKAFPLTSGGKPGAVVDALQRYANQREDIWLVPGRPYPFSSWGPNDIQSAREFQEKFPKLYELRGAIDDTADLRTDHWEFESAPSNHAITWMESFRQACVTSIAAG